MLGWPSLGRASHSLTGFTLTPVVLRLLSAALQSEQLVKGGGAVGWELLPLPLPLRPRCLRSATTRPTAAPVMRTATT